VNKYFHNNNFTASFISIKIEKLRQAGTPRYVPQSRHRVQLEGRIWGRCNPSYRGSIFLWQVT